MTYQISIIITICVVVLFLILDAFIFKKYYEVKIPHYIQLITVFVFSVIIYAILIEKTPTLYNNYHYLAKALLEGHIDVPSLPSYLENIWVDGKQYMHFAPGPSVFLMPFVAIWGMEFNPVYLSILLGAGANTFFFGALQGFDIKSNGAKVWATIFFGFGTVHCFLTAIPNSWFFGQIMGNFFITLSMFVLIKGERKISIVVSGFLFIFAVVCRMPMLLSGFVFLYLLFTVRKAGFKECLLFIYGGLMPGILFLLYNYARFGTFMDMGYALEFEEAHPGDDGGPLQFGFIPHNFFSLVGLGYEFDLGFPYFKPSINGTALILTTPAIVLSFFAKGKFRRIAALISAVALCSIPFLMNWGNGAAQFGMRYFMESTMFLVILAAITLDNSYEKLGKIPVVYRILIGISVILNVMGPLYWKYVLFV